MLYSMLYSHSLLCPFEPFLLYLNCFLKDRQLVLYLLDSY